MDQPANLLLFAKILNTPVINPLINMLCCSAQSRELFLQVFALGDDVVGLFTNFGTNNQSETSCGEIQVPA